MEYDCIIKLGTAHKGVLHFIDWLYDEECPVSPEEVTREKLIEIWGVYRETGVSPTREESLPHTRINVAEQKARLFQILK